MARKFFGGLTDMNTLDAKDIRRTMSRFQGDHLQKNLALLPPMEAMAKDMGVSIAQLALAWVLAQGDHIVSIPGTTDVQHMKDNFAAQDISLSSAQVEQLNQMINRHNVSGPRYDTQSQSEVDTEFFV